MGVGIPCDFSHRAVSPYNLHQITVPLLLSGNQGFHVYVNRMDSPRSR